MIDQRTGSLLPKASSNERGVALLTVMMITLMTGVLGVAALTMTGLENSMAGAMRMVEEGTHAAESCVGTAVRVINLGMEDSDFASADALVVVAPLGPVPALNKTFLGQEISGTLRNNPDVAVGAGSSPNLTFTVNNYLINGDIDYLYMKMKAGGDAAEDRRFFYRVDCTAANAATGSTSRVIAVFECYWKGKESCEKRTDA
jgi:hypothetical protein